VRVVVDFENGGIAMKIVAAPVAVVLLSGGAFAQGTACTGQVVTKTGPNGKTLSLCMDGKYSTCLRDAQRLGWPYAEAKKNCDRRKAAGAVK
jgi:hypothetical protein